MKKLILILFVGSLSLISNAQENGIAANRASNAVKMISNQLEMSADEAKFLEETLYNKYITNSQRIAGNNLTTEEVKTKYRKNQAETMKVLLAECTKEEIRMITKFGRASFKRE